MLRKQLQYQKKIIIIRVQYTRIIGIAYIDFLSPKIVCKFNSFYPKDQIEMVKIVFSILIISKPQKKVENYFK